MCNFNLLHVVSYIDKYILLQEMVLIMSLDRTLQDLEEMLAELQLLPT